MKKLILKQTARHMSRPLSMKQAVKIMHICSVIIYPLKKKFIGTSSIMARGKCRALPADSICQVVTGTAMIFHLAGR